MHQPTYWVLTGSAMVFGAINLVRLHHANAVLFWVSVFSTLCMIAIALLAEEIECTSRLWCIVIFVLPALLIVLASTLQVNEAVNAAVTKFPFGGFPVPKLDSDLPGKSVDYTAAAHHQTIAVLFPLLARWIAKGVGVALAFWRNADDF